MFKWILLSKIKWLKARTSLQYPWNCIIEISQERWIQVNFVHYFKIHSQIASKYSCRCKEKCWLSIFLFSFPNSKYDLIGPDKIHDGNYHSIVDVTSQNGNGQRLARKAFNLNNGATKQKLHTCMKRKTKEFPLWALLKLVVFQSGKWNLVIQNIVKINTMQLSSLFKFTLPCSTIFDHKSLILKRYKTRPVIIGSHQYSMIYKIGFVIMVEQGKKSLLALLPLVSSILNTIIINIYSLQL